MYKAIFIVIFIINGFILIQVKADINNLTVSEGISTGFLYKNETLDEASGLAASRKNNNILWVHEDDWGPFIYAMKVDGTILGRYQVGNDGYDVEDIAIGPGPNESIDYLYIGHIGDNNAIRSTIYIKRVKEPFINNDFSYNENNLTNYDIILLQYPDGAKDAESLMVDTNGDIYIVSKRLSSNNIYLARYPQSTTKINSLELVKILPDKPEFKSITAGDISPNGEWIILRNDQINDYASLWHRTKHSDLKYVFDDEYRLININDEPQGEAICFDSNSLGFYTVSEHAGFDSVPIWYYQISPTKIADKNNNSSFDFSLLLIIFLMIFLAISFIFIKNTKVSNIIFSLVIVISLCVYSSTNIFGNEATIIDNNEIINSISQEKILTVSYNSTDISYTLDELITSFGSVSGLGAKINQIGKISGPSTYTGIPIDLLLRSIDDLPENYYLLARANDYEYNFSINNVNGKFELYNKDGSLSNVGNMTMILVYKTNDNLLDKTTGGPLRIGLIDDIGSITHSSMWVSSVNKLILIKTEKSKQKNCNIPPIISINVSNVSGYTPLKVYFYANVTDPDGNITSYKWDFGDGSSETKKNTQHTYKKAGSYIASFQATDDNDSTNIKTIHINVSYLVIDGCVSPTDYLDYDNDWNNAEQAFDNNLKTFAKSTKKGFWRWRWTGFLELISPVSLQCNKIRFKACYSSNWCDEIDIDIFSSNKWNDIYQGSYKNKKWETIEFPLDNITKTRVRFHLRQAFRGTNAELYEFNFYSETDNLVPNADFSFTPTKPYRNQEIYFTDESYDNDGELFSWYWQFGDGSESTKRNPTHRYSELGYYTINLTVTDDKGSTNNILKKISIKNQIPIADFSYTPSKPTVENKIYFNDESSDIDGYFIEWFWDFGDEKTSTKKNPTHQYKLEGRYIVKLTVKDNDNSISEINKEIVISPPSKDWNLSLSGISNMNINRKQFETWVTQYETFWSDGNHTWCGIPLWRVISMIDDPIPNDHVFNDSLSESGYTIRLTAGDNWITELDSNVVSYNEGYLIVNTIDGEILPEYTPKGHPSWPLHLRGEDIHPPNNVGNIVSIEIILN